MGESTLLVVTKSMELRVLYTKYFNREKFSG